MADTAEESAPLLAPHPPPNDSGPVVVRGTANASAEAAHSHRGDTYVGVAPPAARSLNGINADGTPTQRRGCCTRRRCLCSLVSVAVVAGLAVVGVIYVYPLLLKYEGGGPRAPKEAPGLPQAPVIREMGRSDARVEWQAPQESGTGTVTMYGVQWRGDSDDWPEHPQINVSDVRTRVRNLLGGMLYCFRVRAVSSAGPGNYSEAACNTTEPAIAPAGPAEVLPLDTSPSEIVVGVQAGADNGEPIDAIVVEVEPTAASVLDAAWALGCIVTLPCSDEMDALCNCTISSLVAGKGYNLRLQANSSAGESEWVTVSSWHTDKTGSTVPGPATSVDAFDTEPSRLGIGWKPPRDDGGAMILRYELQGTMAAASNASWKTMSEGYRQDANVTGLKGNTSYCFRVRAVNGNGAGPWSTPNGTDEGGANCFATSDPEPPNAPKFFPLPVQTSSLSIAVGWTEPRSNGQKIQNYTLQKDDWWIDAPLGTVYEGPEAAFNATQSMLPATTYNFRVLATNAIGNSSWSAVVNYSTDRAGYCGNPDDVAAYKRTKTTMKKDIQLCLIGCVGQGQSCVVDCINDKVGLSKPCAVCWYHEGECTVKKCLAPCTAPNSKACADCSERNCFPDCVECSGIPREFFPP